MAKRPAIFLTTFAVALGVSLLPGSCRAQTVSRLTPKQDQAIRKFLVGYLGPPYPPIEEKQPTRYAAALVGLTDGAAGDVIVYLTGKTTCGLGGCTTLVLAARGSSYRVLSKLPMTHPPIRVLAATTNGWHELDIQMGGGSRQPEYEAKYAFNGKTYAFADNPPLRLLKSLGGKVPPGTDVVFGGHGELLYSKPEMKAARASRSKPSRSLLAAFIPILPELKAKSSVPILLPSKLPYPIGRARHAVVYKAATGEYGISLYYGQDQADDDFAADFAAQSPPPYSPQEIGNVREVKLSGGIRGFFRPVSCGGSCAPANLWWEKDRVLYSVQLGLSPGLSDSDQEKDMVDAANSAILAGPR